MDSPTAAAEPSVEESLRRIIAAQRTELDSLRSFASSEAETLQEELLRLKQQLAEKDADSVRHEVRMCAGNVWSLFHASKLTTTASVRHCPHASQTCRWYLLPCAPFLPTIATGQCGTAAQCARRNHRR